MYCAKSAISLIYFEKAKHNIKGNPTIPLTRQNITISTFSPKPVGTVEKSRKERDRESMCET